MDPFQGEQAASFKYKADADKRFGLTPLFLPWSRPKTARLNFAAVTDCLPSCFQSESVKYFLDNLDRIGQLVSHRDDGLLASSPPAA